MLTVRANLLSKAESSRHILIFIGAIKSLENNRFALVSFDPNKFYSFLVMGERLFMIAVLCVSVYPKHVHAKLVLNKYTNITSRLASLETQALRCVS